MEKKVKVKNVVAAFNILKHAKYSKMKDSDRINLWKIFREIKPIGKEYEEDVVDLQQKLMPYDTFDEDLQKAIKYEAAKSSNEVCEDMTDYEYKNFMPQFRRYQTAIQNAVKDIEEKEVTLNFEPLSSDAFERFSVSNDWTFSQLDLIEEFIC